MLRLARYLLGVGILTAAAVWLADRPGAVSLDWLGWRVETSVPLLLVLLLLVGFLLFWLARVFGFVFGMPSVFGHMLTERRQRRGYEALTKGLVAVAAGDPKEALRQAKHADGFLGAPPLSLLLAAQAAQLAGDEEGAAKHFDAMRNRPETEFLALRGLITQALKKGDKGQALALAKRAYRLKPEAEWVFTALFSLLVEAGDWSEALEVVKKAAKHRLIDAPASKRRQALLKLEAAKAASDVEHGAKLADAASELAPDLPMAACVATAFLKKTGKVSKALKLLETSWRACPHPALYAALVDLLDKEDPLKRMLAIEKMTSRVANDPESRIALARAALEAKLWGKARSSLETLLAANQPEARVIALMASIDEAEGRIGDSIQWLKKMPEAAADPVWVCQACGHVAEEWSAVCPACQGFDALVWKRRQRPLERISVVSQE